MAKIPTIISTIGRLAKIVARKYFFLENKIHEPAIPSTTIKGYSIRQSTKMIVAILSSEPVLSNIMGDIIMTGREGRTRNPKIEVVTMRYVLVLFLFLSE